MINIFSSAFTLIWHTEEPIRSAIVQAFYSVFLTDGGTEPQSLPPIEIAMNLQNLYLRCMQDEPHSFERILNDCYAKQLLQEEVVEACWGSITQGKNAYSALQILSMMGTATGDGLHMMELVEVTLPQAYEDQDLLLLTAIMKYLASIEPSQRPSISLIVQFLRGILVGTICLNTDSSTRTWFALCEETMHVIFAYHSTPDHLLSNILLEVYGNISRDANHQPTCSPYPLARFLFLFGQMTLNMLLYSESLAKSAKIANERNNNNNSHDVNGDEVDAMEAEMGLAAAADADHEQVTKLLQLIF